MTSLETSDLYRWFFLSEYIPKPHEYAGFSWN
ncbi:hypothetical protein CPS_4028 [Colwellia psychrerythraea 34H]|uniref:Uncharacterized protein n=1 Tax=Colwellia psychrerythraea (strain 34H / ATCC BAA-681) TaxID=167879 RepID=Q47WY5_COLP3|nr:hypothetical protein CPS_4028 [Colwellia psychrerythraea 34H]